MESNDLKSQRADKKNSNKKNKFPLHAIRMHLHVYIPYQQNFSYFGDSSQILVSWTVFNQYVTSPLS